MGRASSKKVARAASTGGGRTAGPARPYGWWLAMALVVVLGIGGIVFSRQERIDELAAGKDSSAPAANKDHWHAAYGAFLCDEFAAPITDQRDPKGIHTHGDGVIHIHPFVRSAAGRNATLGVFADAVKMTLTDTELRLPGGKSYRSGRTECNGKKGVVQVKVNNKKALTVNLRQIKMNDRDLVTIAFAPRGAELPSPPSAPNLDRLTDVPGSGSTVPGEAGVPGDAGAPGDTTDPGATTNSSAPDGTATTQGSTPTSSP